VPIALQIESHKSTGG